MKELLAYGIEKQAPAEQKVNLLRENLQVIMLKYLSDRGAFRKISFVGGTALRIIHGLNRFSEDLDFSLVRAKGFDFEKIAKGIEKDLKNAGIPGPVKYGGKGAVRFALFKFPGLLSEFGVSPLAAENLRVKIEIDMNPPSGWENETTLVNRFYIFQLNAYNIASLFSGKLHACLYRTYAKARDYYDLMWYLSKKTEPNYRMLSSAAGQTEKKKVKIDRDILSGMLLKKLKSVDFKAVKKDVSKFLINPSEAELLSFEIFKKLVSGL